ncbi:MAG: XRE family transcriptional regulator [Cytophagia bacterium]|nr:MAG: XRE family transcriptional regulator [Cytophagales bacterium]TAG38095.1 MAG: XRE family transcriptional regulator [Cytophagia bacterium]TAG79526.1 MAG: XRE family transcriptional regulator [Cytophagales bacterium]
MSYGTKLRTIRDNRKLSQQQVADFVGIAQPTLNNWEQDISSPKVKHLPKLAEVLQVDIADVATEGTVVKIMDNSHQTNNDDAVVGFEVTVENGKLYQELLTNKDKIIALKDTIIELLEDKSQQLAQENTALRSQIEQLQK